jgi:hypothetical protein
VSSTSAQTVTLNYSDILRITDDKNALIINLGTGDALNLNGMTSMSKVVDNVLDQRRRKRRRTAANRYITMCSRTATSRCSSATRAVPSTWTATPSRFKTFLALKKAASCGLFY